ncbi:uncharacterized protein MKZ38_007960 [Zalerion maritima]|uniref:Uncharacterized protein n=1 Tax=Zalerion maritima TaxID=339359 RepID=A0AAD5RH69_9PEZI|nr:uncharacterized protein MKZ38_007960 [Zalerion maritima]
MYFSKLAVISLAASVIALPSGNGISHQQIKKRALEVQDYADFQISDGVAGNALDEVAEKFPVSRACPRCGSQHPNLLTFRVSPPPPGQIDESDLANVSQDDLDILKAARETAEAAEVDAGGFNDAIDAAGEDTDEGEALQVGKIKNKVLKLKLEVLALQVEQAQGEDNQDKIDEEQTKLDANVATDEDSAGATSQSVDFQGTSDPDAEEGDAEDVEDDGDADEEEEDDGDADEEEEDDGDAEDVEDDGDADEEEDDGDAEDVEDDGDAEDVEDDGDAEDVEDDGDAEDAEDDGDADEEEDDGDAEDVEDDCDADEEEDDD